MTGLHDIDVDFNFFDDTPAGKDPDSRSPRLREYHQVLWSRSIPGHAAFELTRPKALSPYLVYEKNGTRIVLGSDTIATRHRKKLAHLFHQAPAEVTDAFLRRSYTICGFMVFPVSQGSINQRRGTNPRIHDRWDLTLECIKRHYAGGTSPLSEVLARHANFFAIFGDFNGYVERFLLQDFIADDGTVRMLLPFNDFAGPVLPSDIDGYRAYLARSLAIFEARRDRIARVVAAG